MPYASGWRNAAAWRLGDFHSASGLLMGKDKETPQYASLRLWIAVLLSIAALWFVDFLLKPLAHRHSTTPAGEIVPMTRAPAPQPRLERDDR